MYGQAQPETVEQTILIDCILADYPSIGTIGNNNRFASCTVRAVGPVGSGPSAQNCAWSVAVHRQPAVELLRGSMPGDILQIRGIVQGAQIIVPRQAGRIDILLCD